MDVKQIVLQLHELAQDPEKCVSIMQDKTCLPGIVLFLDNPDQEIVHTSVDTLRLLSEIEVNQPAMLTDVGVMMGLKKVLENPQLPTTTKQLAAQVFRNIQPKPKPQPQKPDPDLTAQNRRVQRPAQQHSFFNVSGKTARLLTLYVPGIAKSDNKKLAEEALLKVKGLVSFTFNTREEYVIVRALDNVPPAKFASAIAATGTLKAQQVVKGDDGKDVFVDVVDETSTPALKTDADGYLDDDDTPYEKELSGKALARVNDSKSGRGGWFGTVGNYIAKSLYW